MSRSGARLATATLGASLLAGCAQIRTTSTVELHPRGQPVQLGPPGGMVDHSDYRAEWVQVGPELLVSLTEHRTCRTELHLPVTRVEHLERRPDGAIYWEVGLAAITGTLAGFAFGRPEAFSNAAYNDQGEVITDPAAGYRVGGIFAGISALLVTGFVVDLARARDSTRYADAYERAEGPIAPCADPVLPVVDTNVHLVVGGYLADGVTDARGRVRLRLPDQRERDEVARLTQQSGVVPAAVRVDDLHAVKVDFRLPYDAPGVAHSGRSEPPEPSP